jgi:hypothetical protein
MDGNINGIFGKRKLGRQQPGIAVKWPDRNPKPSP